MRSSDRFYITSGVRLSACWTILIGLVVTTAWRIFIMCLEGI